MKAVVDDWKATLVRLIDKLEEEVIDLTMERYEEGEYHPNVSTSGRDDARLMIERHIAKLRGTDLNTIYIDK